MRATTLFAILTVAAACGGKESAEQQAMPGMDNLPGMAGMTMRSDSLMPMMLAHLDSLAASPGRASAEMLATHDARASVLLDAMGADMTMMGMRPDSAWTALIDSVKRDLAELPSLSGGALEALMRVHVKRVQRLLDMHGRMMRSMAAP